MTNDEIDLFVDRLCGYWPTTNIARNTVKSAWKQSMPLRSLPAKQAKLMLEKIKTMPGFPSLNTVENLATEHMGRDKQHTPCEHCHNDTWLPVPPIILWGYEYTQVVRCVCSGGSWDEVTERGGLWQPPIPVLDREHFLRLAEETGRTLFELVQEHLAAAR